MKKHEAIQILGGTPKKAAQALGYKSAHAIYVWKDELPAATVDRVYGAAARLGIKLPKTRPVAK